MKNPQSTFLQRQRLLMKWHWISSALCLMGLFFFALTGITLNHSDLFEASTPQVTQLTATLPADLLSPLQTLAATTAASNSKRALPLELYRWLESHWGINLPHGKIEWNEQEVTQSAPRPGVETWLAINLNTGLTRFEINDRGWVAYFDDLHKGRHAGQFWRWFIDLFAVLTCIVAVTGLWLLYLYAPTRRWVWPLVAWGALLPVMLMLLAIH